jgi:hypothetical protein
MNIFFRFCLSGYSAADTWEIITVPILLGVVSNYNYGEDANF